MPGTDHRVTSIAELEAIFGQPSGAAVWKQIDHISPEYGAFINAAPFFAPALARLIAGMSEPDEKRWFAAHDPSKDRGAIADFVSAAEASA